MDNQHNDLRVIARNIIKERGDDIDDAWQLFYDEARARYIPEDDGDGDEYLAAATEIFNEERQAVAEA